MDGQQLLKNFDDFFGGGNASTGVPVLKFPVEPETVRKIVPEHLLTQFNQHCAQGAEFFSECHYKGRLFGSKLRTHENRWCSFDKNAAELDNVGYGESAYFIITEGKQTAVILQHAKATDCIGSEKYMCVVQRSASNDVDPAFHIPCTQLLGLFAEGPRLVQPTTSVTRDVNAMKRFVVLLPVYANR